MKKLLHTFFTLMILCGFQMIQAQTFSGVFNGTIPDNAPAVYFDIPVSGLPATIDSLFGVEKVQLNITHTWDADLSVSLKAPDGTTVLLFSGVGADGDNFTQTILGDTGMPVGNGTAPFTGIFKTQGMLGDANNHQNPNGTWTLICQDNAAQDQGVLIDWSITFSNSPAQPFSFISSNLPIIIMNTGGVDIPNDIKIPSSFSVIDHGFGNRNFTDDTTFAFAGNILVELQGFTGPYYPKKNFDFDLVDTGGNKIDTSLLGMPSENDWILKAEYLDHSLIKNSLTYTFARHMGIYAPRTMYCEVILNGNYIGVYTLTEKVKQSPHRLNIANLSAADTSGQNLTGGYIFEMNINGVPPDWTSAYLPANTNTSPYNVEFKHVDPKSAVIQPQQHNYIKSWTDSFEYALANQNFQDTLIGFRKWANEYSFIDFCIVNEFSTNYDSYGRSTYLYKNKSTHADSLLHIGPPWDYDRAYGNTTGWVYEITHPLWPYPFWWMKFQQDSLYKDHFFCRYFSYRQSILNTDSMLNFIDSISNLLQESAARNFARWPETGVSNYNNEVNALKDIVQQRMVWMDANINSNFLSMPVLTMNDTLMCNGGIISLPPQTGIVYEWSNGTVGNSSVITTAGNYNVEAENNWGCKTTADFNVSFLPSPNALFNITALGGFMYSFLPVDTNQIAYHWNFGDGTFSNQVHPVHHFMQTGLSVITLTVTGANTCEAISIDSVYAFADGIISINDGMNFISPNPATLETKIHLQQANDEIKITNLLGEIVWQQHANENNITLSLSHWPAGLYFVNITEADGKKVVLKLMVSD